MTKAEHGKDYLSEEIDRIVNRIRSIQRAIRASDQPASQLEIEELKELGREYGRVIARFERSSDKKQGT